MLFFPFEILVELPNELLREGDFKQPFVFSSVYQISLSASHLCCKGFAYFQTLAGIVIIGKSHCFADTATGVVKSHKQRTPLDVIYNGYELFKLVPFPEEHFVLCFVSFRNRDTGENIANVISAITPIQKVVEVQTHPFERGKRVEFAIGLFQFPQCVLPLVEIVL